MEDYVQTITVKPIDINQEEVNKQVEFFKQEYKDTVIVNQLQYEQTAEWVREIEKFSFELEKRRKEITKPLDEAKKSCLDLFRTPVERCALIADSLRAKMMAFATKMEQERIEAQRKLELEAEKKAKKAEAKGNVEKAEELRRDVAIAPHALASSPSVSMVKKWKFKVKEIALVPEAFIVKSVDEKMVQAYIEKNEDKASIAGIEIWFEMAPRIRK